MYITFKGVMYCYASNIVKCSNIANVLVDRLVPKRVIPNTNTQHVTYSTCNSNLFLHRW